nr:photosystem I assembly protein Ycf33 [Proteomonas sp. NIES-1005]
MPDFWENVARFPRFFISSMIGLILTLIGPFLNLLEKPTTASFFVGLLIILISTLVLTLQAMLGLGS